MLKFSLRHTLLLSAAGVLAAMACGGEDTGPDSEYVTETAPVLSDSIRPAVDCSLIAAANPEWEVCETSADSCAGVYADGAGCQAYCAAAGLVCAGHFGGQPGCSKELEHPLGCGVELIVRHQRLARSSTNPGV